MRSLHLSLALTLIVCGIISLGASVSPTPASKYGGDQAAGAKLAQTNGCAACHGAGLKGGSAPSLVGIENRLSPDVIASRIAHPQPPMPAFGLSDAQVADLVAYISSLDAAGRPQITLDPAAPVDHANVLVRFPGPPPAHAAVQATMQMGSMSHGSSWIALRQTKDPHTLAALVNFSMGGAWLLHVRYGNGQEITMPVDVGTAP